MNTTSALRSALAAVAAGALVLGSAGAATAHPKSPKAKGPKPAATAEAVPSAKLAKVDIKRHKKIDLADVTATTAINLRAMVRYSAKVEQASALPSFGVVLAVYDKKVNGTRVGGSESTPALVELKARTKAKKNQFYKGSAVITEVWTTPQIAALAAAVKANGKAYICIDSVDADFEKYSKQTRKRLNIDVKKPVRDCVKVVGELPPAPETSTEPTA